MDNNLDRKCSIDEKAQKERLKKILKEISVESGISLSLEKWDSQNANSRNSTFITEEGRILRVKDAERRKGRDSKAFDGTAVFCSSDKELIVYFFCKYTKEHGGNQDSIMYEVVKTTDNISKCIRKDCIFFFLMEGGRWENDEQLKVNGGFGNKSILLPTNENDSEIKSVIKNNILNYFNK